MKLCLSEYYTTIERVGVSVHCTPLCKKTGLGFKVQALSPY